MRILIAVHGYPPTHNGGAERRAERTARALVAQGVQVRVLCIESVVDTPPQPSWDERDQDGVCVRRLALRAFDNHAQYRASYDNPQTGDAVKELIAEWRPDVVHLFSGYLLTASVLRVAAEQHIPTVVSLTDYWWICQRINLIRWDGARCDGPTPIGCARCHAEELRRYRVPARKFPRAADQLWRAVARVPALADQVGVPAQIARAETLMRLLGHARVMISPSQYLADQYIARGAPAERMRAWRQGVQLDQCVLRKPSPVLRVGYMGQMKRHKGVDLILDAWAQLRGEHPRELRLYGSAAGEDAYAHALRAQMRDLANVTWAGEFRGAQVWQVLADLDVLVVPSRWVENSPNTILEAQAVGVPVIGSNLGGVAELVQHERNGLVFRVDDARDLARQLQRLLDEPDLLPRLRNAETVFRTFEQEVNQLSGLYRELVLQSA
ncbi:MAG: glycosyltransferase family 4 protein [Chloroflexi bacterium]|nr:glycosyltransferase family 4 protein [Chloroflexota bacterium]